MMLIGTIERGRDTKTMEITDQDVQNIDALLTGHGEGLPKLTALLEKHGYSPSSIMTFRERLDSELFDQIIKATAGRRTYTLHANFISLYTSIVYDNLRERYGHLRGLIFTVVTLIKNGYEVPLEGIPIVDTEDEET